MSGSASFGRQAKKYINDFNRCAGALLGIAQGIICDRYLNDQEIHFLNDWLTTNDEIASGWPGDIIHQRVKSVLADGVITEPERAHLVETLQKLVGGNLETLADAKHVTELAFDDVPRVEFPGMRFCLTGNFVYGPRDSCVIEIEKRGGICGNTITKALRYLLIGSNGSEEWKHGSFGTKVDKAMKYKRDGAPILIVKEEHWVSSLRT